MSLKINYKNVKDVDGPHPRWNLFSWCYLAFCIWQKEWHEFPSLPLRRDWYNSLSLKSKYSMWDLLAELGTSPHPRAIRYSWEDGALGYPNLDLVPTSWSVICGWRVEPYCIHMEVPMLAMWIEKRLNRKYHRCHLKSSTLFGEWPFVHLFSLLLWSL